MKEQCALKIPLHLLVLDFVGAALLALGLAEWFANTGLVPESLRFENYYIVMVIVGGLLMLPVLFHFMKLARSGWRGR